MEYKFLPKTAQEYTESRFQYSDLKLEQPFILGVAYCTVSRLKEIGFDPKEVCG
jgi:hypothetical protein